MGNTTSKRARRTLWLDVAMGNPKLMQVGQALEKLQRVDHDDLLVLDAPVLQQVGERPARTEFHKHVNAVAVHLDAVVGDHVGVVDALQDAHLVVDLARNVGDQLGVLQADLLDGHQLARVEIHGGVDVAECAAADKVALLPPHGEVCGRRREPGERAVYFVGRLQNAAHGGPVQENLPPVLVHLGQLLEPVLLDILGCGHVIHDLALVEAFQLVHERLHPQPLGLGGKAGPGAHDVKVRDQERHAPGHLGPQLGVLVVAKRQDVLAARHDHGELEGLHRPAERLAVGRDAVVADEADPVERELGQLHVVHGAPVVVHVEQRPLSKLGGEDEAGLDQLLAVHASCLPPNGLDTVHEGV